MKLAENQGNNEKSTHLKQDVALQRRIMDKIVIITMDMGHPMIVEKYVFPSLNFLVSPTYPAHGCYGHRSPKQIERAMHVKPLPVALDQVATKGIELRAFFPCSGVISLYNVLP